MSDPLTALPAEIVLRIIDFTTPLETTRLARLNKSWNRFVDETHQDHIYSSNSKTAHPPGCRDFSFLDSSQSFTRYYEDVERWKDLCKRQTLLNRAWLDTRPTTTESIIQVGTRPVWRFHPDFKRRIIISTSQNGGLYVTDMDTGRPLWSLDEDTVRPFAHLEYQDGVAAWDRYGSAIEIWKADDTQRGTFQRTAVLEHDCETRGFQLSFNTLCVVSSEGQGFVYDMTRDPPLLTTRIDISVGAVGHLYQSEDVVVYSMGTDGYCFHVKQTGLSLGLLHPRSYKNVYHILHPHSTAKPIRHGATESIFPPEHPRKDRLVSLRVEGGPHPSRVSNLSLEEDEWGAGMIADNFMVGVSRGGRIYICSDWRGSLSSPTRAAETSALIECDSDGMSFDLGGWLSVKNGRILFEINDRVYIFTLNREGVLPKSGVESLPVWATFTSTAPQLTAPVSFMAVYDDCFMTTYTTIGWRSANTSARPARFRTLQTFPTKAIRIVSLAPDLSDNPPDLEDDDSEGEKDVDTDGSTSGARDRSHDRLLRLVGLLDGEDEGTFDEGPLDEID